MGASVSTFHLSQIEAMLQDLHLESRYKKGELASLYFVEGLSETQIMAKLGEKNLQKRTCYGCGCEEKAALKVCGGCQYTLYCVSAVICHALDIVADAVLPVIDSEVPTQG